MSSRHNRDTRDRGGDRGGSRGQHSNHYSDRDTGQQHSYGSSRQSSGGGHESSYGGSRLQTVSECSTGDATPTSEGEAEKQQEQGVTNGTHPGGAVSLSAAMSRISQPQVNKDFSASTRLSYSVSPFKVFLKATPSHSSPYLCCEL